MDSIKSQVRVINLILLNLAGLIFLVSFYTDWGDLKHWHIFSYFFHLLVVGLCLAGTLALNWFEKGSLNFKCSQFTLLAAMVFIFGALLRLSYVNDLTVWLDEYVQISNKYTPFVEAAKQQQPPFIYQLSTWLVEKFGYTEFWLRSSSVAFGSLSILLAAVLGRILNFRFSVQALWLLSIALNPMLIRYSFEGRPNIAGVFFCLLWLCTLALALKSKKPGKSDFLRILIATYFFCSTIGMQSLALPLYSLPILFFITFQDRNKAVGSVTIFSQIAGLVLFIPVLIGIVWESIPRAQFHSVEKWTDRLFNFSELAWAEGGKKIFEMIPFYEILLIVAALSIGLRYLKERNIRENYRNHLLLTAFLLLPFIYTWIFQVTINWIFYVRYLLCYVVIFYLFVAHFLNQALLSYPPNHEKMSRWVVSGLSLLVLVGSTYYIKSYGSVSSLHNYGSDIRGVFNKIVETRAQKTRISMFTIDINAAWEPRSIVAPEFYLKNYDSGGFDLRFFGQKVYADGDQIQYMVKEISSNTYDDLFLLMGPFQHFNNQSFYVPGEDESRIEVFSFEGYQVLRVEAREESIPDILIDYFEKWERENKNPSFEFKLKEVQFYLYFYKGDLSRAEPFYRWLKDKDPEGNLLIIQKQLLVDSIWNSTE